MTNSKVKAAVQAVRNTKDWEGRKLSPKYYSLFLNELLAEAEGWKMELEEMDSADQD